jgi:hypothetical protein
MCKDYCGVPYLAFARHGMFFHHFVQPANAKHRPMLQAAAMLSLAFGAALLNHLVQAAIRGCDNAKVAAFHWF